MHPCTCKRKEQRPLTAAQQGIWYVYQEEPTSYAFHLALEYGFMTSFDTMNVIKSLIQQHSLLRTTCSTVTDPTTASVVCVVHEPDCAWIIAEQQRLIETAWSAHEESHNCLRKPFNLEQELPFRLHTYSQPMEQRLKCLLVVHHIICDGYSLPLLHGTLTNTASAVDSSSINRTDNSVSTVSNAKQFWHDHIQNANLDFHLLSNRLTDESSIGAKDIRVIDLDAFSPDILKQANELVRSHHVTIFSLCSTAFWWILQHMSGTVCNAEQAVIPIGMSFLGTRDYQSGIQQASNALPVCFRPRSSTETDLGRSSWPLIQEMHQTIQLCKRHETYDSVQFARDMRRRTGFFRNGITVLPYFPVPSHVESFYVHLFTEDDLMLVLLRGKTREEWHLRLVYQHHLFTPAWVQRLGAAIMHQIQLWITPNQSYLCTQQQERLLKSLQAPVCPSIRHLHVWKLIQSAFTLHTKRIAMVCGAIEMTYERMIQVVDQIASVVRQRSDTLRSMLNDSGVVAIIGHRSIASITCMLVAMKVGLVYMCVDVDTLDMNRMQHMLTDSRCCFIMDTRSDRTSQALGSSTENQLLIDPVTFEAVWNTSIIIHNKDSRNPSIQIPNDAIYLKYTSGTTGKPKGIFLTHDGVASMLMATQRDYQVWPQDRVMLFSSISFDASVWQIYAALTSGASVVIPTNGDILGCISEHRITILDTVPSVANMMDPRDYPQLRVLQLGAETCPLHVASKWTQWSKQHPQQGLVVLNSYGPTEAAVMTHIGVMQAEWTKRIPIGRTIPNMKTYILNDRHELVLEGAIGSIWVAGPGVASSGYWNRSDLTSQKFLPNPFVSVHQDAPIMYDTGDIGRWISNTTSNDGEDGCGWIECLGRTDYQVKWNGCRVELSHLEHVALLFREQDPELLECCAVYYPPASETDEPASLVLFFTHSSMGNATAQRQHTLEELLREHMRSHVPVYMVPSHFKCLQNSFPRNSSDKVDRHALPRPKTVAENTHNEMIGAQSMTATEQQQEWIALATIWSDILRCPIEYIQCNYKTFDFYEQGSGSSLQLIQMLHKIKQTFNVPNISIADLYSHPNFWKQYQYICQQRTSITHNFKNSENNGMENKSPIKDAEVCVLVAGYSGVFPFCEGDSHISPTRAFWQRLIQGQVICESGDEQEHKDTKAHTNSFGSLSPRLWETFSHTTFQISRKEAMYMDPQHRLLIECTFQALLQANHAISSATQRIGTFVAINDGTLKHEYLYHPEMSVKDQYQFLSNQMSATAATRLAYTFHFTGPAMTVQTACSSFGAVLDVAVQYLKDGRCDVAVVATSSIRLPQKGPSWEEGMIFSQSGQCRPLEKRSDGITLSNACGVLILLAKPKTYLLTSTAEEIEIVATYVNNDGRSDDKSSFTAPSRNGEADAIAHVLKYTTPEQLAFVEAHATGTAVGDPIECSSIAQSLRRQRAVNDNNTTIISATKAHVGHCDTASGFIGIVKSIMSLEYRLIPKQPDFQQLNSEIHLNDLKVLQIIATEHHQIAPHQTDVLVNSFGIGGSNAVALIRRHAPHKRSNSISNHNSASNQTCWILSHENEQLVRAWAERLVTYCNEECQQANTVSKILYDRFLHIHDLFPKYLANKLTQACAILPIQDANAKVSVTDLTMVPSLTEKTSVSLVICFTGQGHLNGEHMQWMWNRVGQYQTRMIDMVNRMKTIHQLYSDLLYLQFQFPSSPIDLFEQAFLAETSECLAQWIHVAHAISLYDAWQIDMQGHSSVECLGHSLGVYAARIVSKELTIDEALLLIAIRSALISKSKPGMMFAVPCSREQWNELQSASPVSFHSSVSAVNTSKQIVIAISHEVELEFVQWCQSHQLKYHLLKKTVAYHSHLLQDVLQQSDTQQWLEHCRQIFNEYQQQSTTERQQHDGRLPLFINPSNNNTTDTFEWMIDHLVSTVEFESLISMNFTPSNHNQSFATCWLEFGDRVILTKMIQTIRSENNAASLPDLFIHPFQKTWFHAQCKYAWLCADWNRMKTAVDPVDKQQMARNYPLMPLERPSEPLILPTPRKIDLEGAIDSERVVKEKRQYGDRRKSFSTFVHQDVSDLFFRVLGIPSHNVHKYPDANFLELGGDSISAIELLSTFRKLAPNASLTMGAFFARPTLDHLLETLFSSMSISNSAFSQPPSMMEILFSPTEGILTSSLKVVCLIPPVGGTLTLYQDYIRWFQANPERLVDTVVLGHQYSVASGIDVENLSEFYVQQLITTLDELQSEWEIELETIEIKLVGISYGGLVGYHMVSHVDDWQSLFQKIELYLIDTPTPDNLVERSYRSESWTQFDAFKYTFVDIFEPKYPVEFCESKLIQIENELELVAYVCQHLNIGTAQYEEIAKQAQTYLQDVDAIRKYQMHPSINHDVWISTILFVCQEPRQMDPTGVDDEWKRYIQNEDTDGNTQHLTVVATPGDHISMNYEPIVSKYILPRIIA